MKWKIDWLEVDKYGNKKVAATAEDGSKLLSAELGKEYKDLDIKAGHEINAKDWKSPKNGKIYLFMEKEQAEGEKPRGNSNFKSQQIEKVMDKKNESISHFQDKKEESIALMSAQRDSVLIVTTIMGRNGIEYEDGEIKNMIIGWRNWFLSKEFKNTPPF